MLLPVAYHWSPHDRYYAIMQNGLIPYAPPAVHTIFNETTGNDVIGWPYICFALEPSAAWRLSGDMDHASDIEDWDLWQVQFSDGDELHFRSEWGPQILELRVYNAVPPDRVWWVATRTPRSAREAPPIKRVVKKR